jgi:signal transduction histidine kinase
MNLRPPTTSPSEPSGPPAGDAPLWRLPSLVFVVALLATGALSAVLARALERRDAERFDHEVTRITQAVRERADITVALLRGAQGLFAASTEVTRAEFHQYVASLRLREQYPGIQGIGYSQRLVPAQRAPVEAQARAEGVATFRVWPDTPRDEWNAILYLEPDDPRNHAALGFDMATHPARRAAMDAARDSGEARASGKVTLVQEIDDDKQAGFLIYLPVYANGRPLPDVAARRAALQGHVYSPLRTADLLRGARGPDHDFIDYALYDGSEATPAALLRGPDAATPRRPRYSAERRLQVAGRTWMLRFVSLPRFDDFARSRLTPLLLLVPLATSALLAGISLLQVRARRTAEQLARAGAHNARLVGELQETARRKDEFLAMLGHELRNPLAPIVSAIGVLQRGVGPARVAQLQAVIARQARQLTRLVDDLLEAPRISTGRLALQPQPMLFGDAVASAVEALQPTLQQRRQTLRQEQHGTPAPLLGDPARLAQVVTNLLHNASKFSPDGAELHLRVDEHPHEVQLRVSDPGQGIAPGLMPHLFDLFVQGSPQDGHGGLGIGLALVRQVVALHGGKVQAESAGPGCGATFTVTLPRGARS